MLSVALGLLVAAIMVIFFWVSNCEGFLVLGLISIVAGFIFALLPGGLGHDEWKLIEEKELICFSHKSDSETASDTYLLFSEENAYMYRYQVESKLGANTSKETQIETLVNEEVEVIEEINCDTPVLRMYERKGTKNNWKFIKLPKQTKYVFYVPDGTIAKSVNLY